MGLHVQEQGLDEHEPSNPTNTCFDHMEEDRRQSVAGGGSGQERGIWLGGEQDEDLIDMTGSSIFYDDFPSLDFPCMSSTSSSSSTPATVKAVASSSLASSASSSSSAASWAVLKSDGEEDGQNQSCSQFDDEKQQSSAAAAALCSTASMEIPPASDQGCGGDGTDGGCMDVMETFGYMDLIDDNDFFDPSSIFNSDENFLDEFHPEQNLPPPEQKPHPPPEQLTENNQTVAAASDDGGTFQLDSSSDDLAVVFLDWLKSNKETVSAEDLRNVKIKKATIECAAKRLGGGKEAMKQLLKLILEWVQTNHLQKRKMKELELDPLNPNPNPLASNPRLNCNSNSISIPPDQSTTTTPCFVQSPWIPPPQPFPPYMAADPVTGIPGYSPVVGYQYGNGAPNMTPHGHHPYPDYQMLETAQSWPPAQFALASSHYNSYPEQIQPHPPVFNGYGNHYPNPFQYMQGQGQVGDNRQARLGSSATKEARKKRMARQKRFLSHHRSHNHSHNHHQAAAAGADGGHHGMDQQNPANWVYWQTGQIVNPPPGSTVPALPVDAQPVQSSDRTPAMQAQNNQPRQAGSDKRQNWKPEKNLRFLLQKVLKQSDVGTLGRIVLPKKEAETHLPELEARDGISIAMEDIGTSRVWNMRYRFWPNNKSRMYLLENTGDFVRTNGLQEGDFIVIYSDVKCGKYLIRGVKVRQGGTTTKAENKKGGKSQKNTHASSPSGANNNNKNSNQNQNPNQKVK